MDDIDDHSPDADPVRLAPTQTTPSLEKDWPVQATDSIVRLVDSVRDKTTGPALKTARVVVYGTTIALLAGPLLVLLLIGSMRTVEHLLARFFSSVPGFAQPMWIVYLIFGGLFTLAGLCLWRKAGKPAPKRAY